MPRMAVTHAVTLRSHLPYGISCTPVYAEVVSLVLLFRVQNLFSECRLTFLTLF